MITMSTAKNTRNLEAGIKSMISLWNYRMETESSLFEAGRISNNTFPDDYHQTCELQLSGLLQHLKVAPLVTMLAWLKALTPAPISVTGHECIINILPC